MSKRDSYTLTRVKYRAKCHYCGRPLWAGDDSYGQSPEYSGRKRWRFACGRSECQAKHGYAMEPVGDWARKHVEHEANLERVRAAQRSMGGAADE